jgi:hypothetical protein
MIFGDLPIGCIFFDPMGGEYFTKTDIDMAVCNTGGDALVGESAYFNIDDEIELVEGQ